MIAIATLKQHKVSKLMENPRTFDYRAYIRHSEERNFGSASTTVQSEDVPLDASRFFGIDLNSFHRFFKYTELESAFDADTSIRRVSQNKIEVDFGRDQILNLFDEAKASYRANHRGTVMIAFVLSRISRDPFLLTMLMDCCTQTNGNFLIWTASNQQFLDPLDQNDYTTLLIHFGLINHGEIIAKSEFSKRLLRSIAREHPDRVLGGRFGKPGYDIEFTRLEGRNKAVPVFRRSAVGMEVVAKLFEEVLLTEMRPGPLAARMNCMDAPFNRNPSTGTPWNRDVVLRVLQDPIYKGTRAVGRNVVLKPASKKTRRAPQEEWTFSPLDESLRIVTDETFAKVQDLLARHAATKGGGKKKRAHHRKMMEQIGGDENDEDMVVKSGRPLGASLYFHKELRLRCAVCGGFLRPFHRREDEVYYYRCDKLARQCQMPVCQRHVASDVDRWVEEELRKSFTNLDPYMGELRREIARAKAPEELETTRKKLAAERQTLAKMRRSLMVMASDLPESELEEWKVSIRSQAATVELLESQVIRFGETPEVQANETLLRHLEALAAFDSTPFVQRVLAMAEVIKAVWIWPDGRMFVQRINMTEADIPWPIRVADHWPTLQFPVLRDLAVKLIEQAETPFSALGEAAALMMGKKKRRKPKAKHDQQGPGPRELQPGTILRVYEFGLHHWVELPKLRGDLNAWIRAELAGGRTMKDVAADLGLSISTIKQIREDAKYKIARFTLEKAATKLGWWQKQEYHAYPDWIFWHERMPEIFNWLLHSNIDGPSQFTSTPDGKCAQVSPCTQFPTYRLFVSPVEMDLPFLLEVVRTSRLHSIFGIDSDAVDTETTQVA